MLSKAHRLAASLQKLHIMFDSVAYGDIFHQCVYLLCQTDPAIMAAGAEARWAFGQDGSAAFMPHLSLLYSDIDERVR